MTIVEFQATIENGTIIVPAEYQQALAEASSVKVTLQKQPQMQAPDLFDQLAQNPIAIPGIRSITRDEIHDRSL
jgi:hypothetical protein